jgi:hypothetical protein
MKKLVSLALLVGTAAVTSAIVLKIKQTTDRQATVTAPLPTIKSKDLVAHGETGLSAPRLNRLKAQLRVATEQLAVDTPIVFEQFVKVTDPQKADGMLETYTQKGYTFRADGTHLTVSVETVADPQILLNHITTVAHIAHSHKMTYHGFDFHPASELS